MDWRRGAWALGLVACFTQLALGQETGRVDSSNIGVATEDAVISSGLPEVNLDFRTFNEGPVPAQQLMHTGNPGYPTPEQGAAAQEYMIFKFDLSTLPAGAQATATGSFDFSAWFTLQEGTPAEELFGQFEFYEITAGNAAWTDRWVVEGVENTTPVTFNNLNGAFSKLTSVTEDDTLPTDTQTNNPFGVLYAGKLVANGGFDGANRVVGIPIETLNRLISGQSIGLALGSVPPLATPPNGDYDDDGDNDGNDFLVWQQQFGTTVDPNTGADGDGSGTVDGADLTIWSDNFGSTGTPGTVGTTNFSIHTTETFFNPASAPTLNFDWSTPAAIASVPEPATGVLLAVAGAGLALRSRRKLC